MSKIIVNRKVLEQALEALEQSETTVPYEGFGMAQREAERKHKAAITALKAVLEQEQEQKPVAWMDDFGNAFPLGAVKGAGLWRDDHQRNWTPLYTHPQRREWRSLTEDEINALWPAPRCDGHDKAFARAIEAALKEKNHE